MVVAKIAITILLWLVQESHVSISAFYTEWANCGAVGVAVLQYIEMTGSKEVRYWLSQ